jgi:hypothetical protein
MWCHAEQSPPRSEFGGRWCCEREEGRSCCLYSTARIGTDGRGHRVLRGVYRTPRTQAALERRPRIRRRLLVAQKLSGVLGWRYCARTCRWLGVLRSSTGYYSCSALFSPSQLPTAVSTPNMGGQYRQLCLQRKSDTNDLSMHLPFAGCLSGHVAQW